MEGGLLPCNLLTNVLEEHDFDTVVQKGGLPQVSCCLEHTGVVTQQIHNAQEGKADLSVLWHLMNMQGSTPHKLRKPWIATMSRKTNQR